MKYQLHRKQQLYCDVETAWKFFSSPANLSKITPAAMQFRMVGEAADQIYAGMEINYTVSPLFGIPMKWKTKITQVEACSSFTDFQEKGPFKFWNHQHFFTENHLGVLMEDRIDYELPLGVAGSLVHRLIVRKKLDAIFDYREKVCARLFNEKSFSI